MNKLLKINIPLNEQYSTCMTSNIFETSEMNHIKDTENYREEIISVIVSVYPDFVLPVISQY